ncbi:hypothetical protein ACIQRS_15390 [Streptomyces termitum]|uniref:Uncharacterized protein n=1 Tax=Streptomyces termitum TaxID=67368 RepID=A0A918T756_9ACTN|nr:hypothetical protein [Streptomyces termitum]GHA98540.1 hypothetical protein GCM10010305_47560 [Streptomyces termitum]
MTRTIIGRAALGIAAAALAVSAAVGAAGAGAGHAVLAEDPCLGAPTGCGPVNGWQAKPNN